MRISHLTMTRFDEGRQRTQTVIQPFGSIEEHGLHLPLSTDTIQVREVCLRAGEETGAFVAPAIPYGVCRSTGRHPGTIGISTPVLRLLVIDLGLAFHRQGLRNFLFTSGHAGKTHLMTILDAAEELLDRLPDIRVAVVSEYNELVHESRQLIETKDDSHAGEIETSRIQFLRPDLVEGTSAEEYPSFPPHILVRDKCRYWPGGVWGNPAKASAEKGRQLMEIAVRHLAGIVRRLEEEEE